MTEAAKKTPEKLIAETISAISPVLKATVIVVCGTRIWSALREFPEASGLTFAGVPVVVSEYMPVHKWVLVPLGEKLTPQRLEELVYQREHSPGDIDSLL